MRQWGMADQTDEFIFNNALCGRVKEARERKQWTAAQMAAALGVPADRYRKYENRSPLPAYLMERFCLIAGVELSWLITGRAVPTLKPFAVKDSKKRA